MRLLHISDWHLGRTTYNTSRAEDHDAVIGEILAYAREHRPDLIVHTGDLFDAVRPAYQAGPEPGIEELFRGYLAEQGTRGAAADLVMATFSTLLQAIETEQEPYFPEEASISAAEPAGGRRGGGPRYTPREDDVALPEMAAPGSRALTCRTCGRLFEAPVRRGRPPAECPACRGT